VLYPKDKKVRVQNTGNELVIRWAIGSRKYLFYTLALPFFAAIGWFAGSAPSVYREPTLRDAIAAAAGVGSLGFAMAYFAAGYALNICEVRANRQSIRFKCGPIPWFRSKSFEAPGISQFFAKEAVRSASMPLSNAVYFIDGDGTADLLCAHLPSTFAMHQVVHELLDFYGLEDLDVYGETHLPSHPGIRQNR
jgi:hypothetical protein